MNDRRRRYPSGDSPTRSLIVLAILVAAGGCAESRSYNVVTSPADASIRIDGEEKARGQLKTSLSYSSPTQAHSIVASRYGFEDASVSATLATPQGKLKLDLKPKVKSINIAVEPTEAQVLLDGKPISDGRVSSVRFELPFSVGETGQPAFHVLRAERPGFAATETPVTFFDERTQYTLHLGALKKDLVIATSPAGAKLTLDGQEVGESPVTLKAQPFAYDAKKEQFLTRTIVATKAGYPPARIDIAWDDGKSEYVLPLNIFSKRVRIETDPPDAILKVDGKPLDAAGDGTRSISLDFPPLDDAGRLREYTVEASVARDGELWKPASATLAWDEGQTAYQIKLEEILVRTVAVRAIEYRAKDGKWGSVVVEANTSAYKDTTDGPLGTAKRVTDLPAGSSIASFAVSPDGKLVVYALVEPDSQGKPKSRMYMCRSDGIGGATTLSDGRQLDLTPTFDPSGDAILFSSDRGGGPMQIWSIPVDGQSGATRLTAGNSDHLWPTLDTSAKPRVFYQALVPGQDVPRLYSTQVGTVFETDLVSTGGFQPRLSPRNDALAFVAFNTQTKRTDLFRTGDKGGTVQKLTDTPDISERDPSWSPDGTKIAFTAEVGQAEGKGMQTDVYIVDANGGNLRAVTMNDALDDLPSWAASGDAVYFRSNRGGKWDIWKIDAK